MFRSMSVVVHRLGPCDDDFLMFIVVQNDDFDVEKFGMTMTFMMKLVTM